MTRIFAKERIVAGPGFNRWLVPPTALAIHLCIGQVYALSGFYSPLSHLIGRTTIAPDDWSPGQIDAIFYVAIVTLGLSTAIASKWLEAMGPRLVAFSAACCFSGGFLVSSVGIGKHEIALMYLGYGVLGGIGIGLGYVSPISMLIQWFPDRRGLAAGIAITGFGAGAIIGLPLFAFLIDHFRSKTSAGVMQALIVMGLTYFVVMTIAAFAMRMPFRGWTPATSTTQFSIGTPDINPSVPVDAAVKTPQFYLLWVILFINVITGIGVLAEAPEMLMESLRGAASSAEIAGFLGFLSLFNVAGRFFCSYASDYIGRKNSNTILLFLGAVFYASLTHLGNRSSLPFFVLQYALIISLYGGIFAMIPAYIADLFGIRFAGAIHGRLLTAWSFGALASLALTLIPKSEISSGLSVQGAGATILYVMSALLLLALVCNLLIKPVDQIPDLKTQNAEPSPTASEQHLERHEERSPASSTFSLIVAWTSVGVPISLGIAWAINEAAALSLSWNLAATLLPLCLGGSVCVGFYFLDQSRFKVRGVVGPYFAAVALLFALYASLMATEVWQRISRTNSLLNVEVSALQSTINITKGLDANNQSVPQAVEDYLKALTDSDRDANPAGPSSDATAEPLRRLYAVAASRDFFHDSDSANSAFYAAIEAIGSSHRERTELKQARLAPAKLFSLLLFGLLTQIAIGFCHGGNQRALSASIMLFSVAFAASVAILELLDGSFLTASAVTKVMLSSLRQ